MQFVYQPAPSGRLGDFLKQNLVGSSWTSFRAAVAFVKRSGTRHIRPHLAAFAATRRVEIIAGIDHRGTSKEGLQDLLDAVRANGTVLLFHNQLPMTFHPKIYLFKSTGRAEILIGSGNLTEGGLYTNYEASMRLELDLAKESDSVLLRSVEDVLNAWADLSAGTALPLDAELLTHLVALGYVPVEALAAPEVDTDRSAEEEAGAGAEEPPVSPFGARSAPRAPAVPRRAPAATAPLASASEPQAVVAVLATATAGPTGFLMTLQLTDVGVGQTTSGTSRRSPEIFVPLAARDAAPEFWRWRDAFQEDARNPGKFDRYNVPMRLGSRVIHVNMMTWPAKHDFRLRNEALRSAGNVGDILRLEKVDPALGFEYYVEVIPKGTTQYPVYLARCSQPVRNSRRLFGYY